jgi:hypothetical protein
MSTETERRNRRFEYIKRNRLYFSAEEIKIRNPNLYHEFVGKEEILLDSTMSLSERIFANIDQQHYEKEMEQECESEEEEDLEFLGKRLSLDSNGEQEPDSDRPRIPANKAAKEELIQYYKEMFLEGKDTDFDYATVDQNPTYDESIPFEQDREDDYFEEFAEPQVNDKEYDY